MNIHERLYSKGILNETTGCLEFSGAKVGGYGIIKYKGKSVKAHRLAYQLEHGEIPDGLVIRHSCDNPSCFNVEHLSVGTQKDNIHDMIDRGRFYTKLTKSDIHEIRTSTDSSKSLSIKFNVTTRRIDQLRRT